MVEIMCHFLRSKFTDLQHCKTPQIYLVNKNHLSNCCFIFVLADEHEVDVIGYGGASDDDHSSIRSGTSDGGVTVTTWRQLSIAGEA